MLIMLEEAEAICVCAILRGDTQKKRRDRATPVPSFFARSMQTKKENPCRRFLASMIMFDDDPRERRQPAGFLKIGPIPALYKPASRS